MDSTIDVADVEWLAYLGSPERLILQALLKAGDAFQKACAAEWIRLFKTKHNRIEAWKS